MCECVCVLLYVSSFAGMHVSDFACMCVYVRISLGVFVFLGVRVCASKTITTRFVISVAKCSEVDELFL